MPLLASLDLGTNTFRLLIAKVTDSNTLVPIVSKRVIVRLGKGIDRNGRIQPHAFEKGIKAIKKFSHTINQHKVEKVFAVSTSVARVAKNGDEFIEKVLEQTGIPVRIVSGFEEATLTLKGIFSAVECNAHKSLLFDIGGGSTELILTEDNVPVQIANLDLGVVHLAESFITTDPPTSEDLASLRINIKHMLQSLDFNKDTLNSIKDISQSSLIGTAGTVTTLAAIDQQLEEYDPQKINNYCLSLKAVQGIYHLLSSTSLAERKAIVGLEQGREEVILPGAAIVLEIMDYFNFKHLTVSDAGLLEGILLDAPVAD